MPIPAIGRAQEIATYLASKILSNELPRVKNQIHKWLQHRKAKFNIVQCK
jgi:phosphoribosylcarboxyaminoimidazole (NCAIR) mutase